MSDLRNEIIRLAHSKPELREHLLPLLKEGGSHDLHTSWRYVTTESEKALAKSYAGLLKNMAGFMKTRGILGLDLQKSSLGRYFSGSDGIRMEGTLYFEDLQYKHSKGFEEHLRGHQELSDWLEDNMGIYGSLQYVGKGNWEIDITES